MADSFSTIRVGNARLSCFRHGGPRTLYSNRRIEVSPHDNLAGPAHVSAVATAQFAHSGISKPYSSTRYSAMCAAFPALKTFAYFRIADGSNGPSNGCILSRSLFVLRALTSHVLRSWIRIRTPPPFRPDVASNSYTNRKRSIPAPRTPCPSLTAGNGEVVPPEREERRNDSNYGPGDDVEAIVPKLRVASRGDVSCNAKWYEDEQ